LLRFVVLLLNFLLLSAEGISVPFLENLDKVTTLDLTLNHFPFSLFFSVLQEAPFEEM
jgi:hypothetical protein